MTRSRNVVFAFVLVLSAVVLSAADNQKTSENCRDCTPNIEQKKTDEERELKLVNACADPAQMAKLSEVDRARYCRWVVRVAPLHASRSRRPNPTPEEQAITQALRDLNAVQPAQISGDHASLLAQRPGAAAGDFSVVWLSKKDGAWSIDNIFDSPGTQRAK